MASGLPVEFLAGVGQGRYQHPRTTQTLASGSTVDLPTLAFALPESDLGCPPPDLGQPCAGRGAAGARRRAPGWLGTSKPWWPHEAITLDSESRAPGLLGGGFQSLEWVLCDFSSCDQKHFSFWSPTPLGTSPPACQQTGLPLQSLSLPSSLYTLQPLPLGRNLSKAVPGKTSSMGF